MSFVRTLRGEFIARKSGWVDGWAVIADTEKFAAKFNSTVPGAYRIISASDIRQMAHCGLIGRHGFFEHADLETVRGILRYEWLRARELGMSSIDLCEQTALCPKLKSNVEFMKRRQIPDKKRITRNL